MFVLLAGIGVVLVAAAPPACARRSRPSDRHPGGVARRSARRRACSGDRASSATRSPAACAFGAMFAYISGSPFVLQDIYGASPQVFSVLFAANALGIVGAQPG